MASKQKSNDISWATEEFSKLRLKDKRLNQRCQKLASALEQQPMEPINQACEDWADMDRFARICWYWQAENSRLRKVVGKTVQFEKILVNYEYFHDEILEPCHIFLDKKGWEIAVASPVIPRKNFPCRNGISGLLNNKKPSGRYAEKRWKNAAMCFNAVYQSYKFNIWI